MIKRVTTAINNVHKNTVSTFGDPRLHKEYGYPLVPGIQFSAAYSFDSPEALVSYHENKYFGNRYCRDSNEGVFQLEQYFEALFPGCRALMYNSGMASMAAALDVLLPDNGEVWFTTETYRKTSAYMKRQCARLNIKMCQFSSLDELEHGLKNSTPSLIVLETPTNPHMYLYDFEYILSLKLKYNCAVLADISIAGLCNIDFDFSQYDCTTLSCTKYISGHNDLLGGVILAGNKKTFEDLWNLRSERGGLMDPMSAYLLLRSLRTYDMRIARQTANALTVLDYLQPIEKISTIYHPSLFKGKQEEIYQRYFNHGGSMISFVININLEEALKRLSSMHSVKMAPSFGAVDTLIEVPAVMSHYGKSKEELIAIGLEPNLIRLSVGCEPVDDLLKDLDFLFDSHS